MAEPNTTKAGARTHTPGPWTVAAWMEGQHGLFLVSTAEHADEITEEGERVGNLPIKSTLANARLIAAAPELLAALAVLLDHAKETYPHFESERGQRDIAQAQRALDRCTNPV